MTAIIPKRIVIDTNVCLDLFVFHDPRWQNLLEALKNGSLEAVCRTDCRAEWLAVLKYPHLPVSPATYEDICQHYDASITCIAPAARTDLHLPNCSDKDDQKFLEIARDGEAAFLITKDKALLKLAKRLRKAGLFSILKPEDFLHTLQQINPECALNQTKS